MLALPAQGLGLTDSKPSKLYIEHPETCHKRQSYYLDIISHYQ